jgi:hypothetical protein
MERSQKLQQLREQYLIRLAEATFPIKEQAEDLEVTLELLIEAADLLKENLSHELEEIRAEQD